MLPTDELAVLTALLAELGARGAAGTGTDGPVDGSRRVAAAAAAAARRAHAERLAASRPPTRQWLEEVLPETTYSAGDGMRNDTCPVCLESLAEKAGAAAAAAAVAAAMAMANPAGDAGAPSPPPPLPLERLSVRTLHCGHGGCLGCIDDWLLSGASACPVCRASVLTSTAHAQLFEAAESDKPDAIHRILDVAGGGVSPREASMSSAAALGEVSRVSVDASPPGSQGRTALMVACGAGATFAVRALLRRGASVSAVDGDGLTPLLHACWAASHACAAALLTQGGADPNVPDAGGECGARGPPRWWRRG
uniref:RING-type domain-containing protein n=1 Tax=Mantoniella antarctica TaxID=81844 RepID=A0A7S0XAH7_9CHLO|mmetsp:Transcript_30820/g.77200  ORF Transcript_30820/g.77200 Transcript_30820/m.77200 type:complete len:309 (+) Transcript_30820:186-1112(+)